jgi:hypothetical protein
MCSRRDAELSVKQTTRSHLIYIDQKFIGRGSWIRTNDLQYPKLALTGFEGDYGTSWDDLSL